ERRARTAGAHLGGRGSPGRRRAGAQRVRATVLALLEPGERSARRDVGRVDPGGAIGARGLTQSCVAKSVSRSALAFASSYSPSARASTWPSRLTTRTAACSV